MSQALFPTRTASSQGPCLKIHDSLLDHGLQDAHFDDGETEVHRNEKKCWGPTQSSWIWQMEGGNHYGLN